MWMLDLRPEAGVSDQLRAQIPFKVGVVQFDDVSSAHHITGGFEWALEHDGKLDALDFVHHRIADEQIGQLGHLALDERLGVAELAHGEARVRVAADLVDVVAADVDAAVGDLVVEDDQVALLDLVAVDPELVARDQLEQALLVDLVGQLDPAGAFVLNEHGVVNAHLEAGMGVAQDDCVALEQVFAVFEVDQVLVHGVFLFR